MTNTFLYEVEQENAHEGQGIKVLDLMKDVLTQINDPNVVLEIIVLRNFYLEAHKSIEEKIVKKSDDIEPKAVTKLRLNGDTYNDFNDRARDVFID